ncbi:MAG: hypothetical protein JWM33_1320 [Caulobacteraceae bacterium]|nr:hypothetical protein [Caulobacteraceae bacterium]
MVAPKTTRSMPGAGVRRAWLMSGLAALALTPVVALAQTAQFDDNAVRVGDFARDRAVSVLERPHPDYAPVPVPQGSFDLYPALSALGEASDNILAEPSGRSDLIVHLRPSIQARSNWSRNAFNLFANADLAGYARTSSQDAISGSLGFNARRDVRGGDALQFGASIARLVEDRTAAGATPGLSDPILYDRADLYGGMVWTFNRLRLLAKADYDGKRFDNGSAGGVPVRLDFRDLDTGEATLRSEYAISPAISTFASITGNLRSPARTVPGIPDRDSRGYEANIGLNFQSGGLWRGEIGAGYLRQDFKNPAYVDSNGLSVHAHVDYFPTQLTTVTFEAARGVNDSGIALAGGYVFTRGSAEIDHELLRNLILTGRVAHEDDDYIGLARTDRTWTSTLSANYLMNRAVMLNLSYRFYDRSSSGVASGRQFRVNSAQVGLTYRY